MASTVPAAAAADALTTEPTTAAPAPREAALRGPSVATIAVRPRAVEPVGTVEPVGSKPVADPPANSAEPEATIDAEGLAQDGASADRWDTLVREPAVAGALAGLARELAWQSVLTAVEPGEPPVWRLVVAHETLCRPALQDKLEQALSAHLGHRLRLVVQPGQPVGSPSQRDAVARERRQQQAESDILEDPLVQGLMARFPGARVVPGSIRPV